MPCRRSMGSRVLLIACTLAACAAHNRLPAAVGAERSPAEAVITELSDPVGWKIQTAASVYQIAVASDGIVIPVYYGARGVPTQVHRPRVKVDPKRGSTIRELPFRGGFVEQTPAVEVVYHDGTRECDLVYQSSEICEEDGHPCLRVDLKDSAYGLAVSACYRVMAELDVVEKWVVLSNESDEPILIENAQSSSAWLPPDEYDLVHLAGRWGHEFLPHRARLTPGVKTIQVRDFVAHNNPPWFAVAPAHQGDETDGPVWFGSLHYSGNWRLDFEKAFSGHVQVVGGINFWDTTWTLEPDQSFTTPKMVVGYSPDGMGGASERMHRYVRGHVLPAEFRDKLRPVLYNSWYATTFNVNEEHQLALARVAKEIGVELFVIDDGWFKGRVNDRGGLGDWTVDRKKFPNGLQPMIRKINDLGLDFGIWVEPEMVNPNSDLYQEHPDWVLHSPNRTRHERRNQLMLNLAREDVCEYLSESLTKLLSENDVKFIKWDRNRPISEAGWPDAGQTAQREVRIRFIHNLYGLIDRLRARFPDVWFETCSGGGGRADLGILSRTDQVWTSDNTDPADRLMIQHGFSHYLPANTMVSWVTDKSWHQNEPSLKFRFHVSMGGVLGVGNDLLAWSPDERQVAAEMIALYKEIRPLVQKGLVHRLRPPVESERVAVEYAAADASKAALLLFNLREPMAGST
ncbi:MAG: alpha-galactosidase, partial [Planctomycetota bacterium]